MGNNYVMAETLDLKSQPPATFIDPLVLKKPEPQLALHKVVVRVNQEVEMLSSASDNTHTHT